MFNEIYTQTRKIRPDLLGSFAGSTENLVVPFSIPTEFLETLTKFKLVVAYKTNFDYVGWAAGAFRYDQSLFTLFEVANKGVGTITCQFDSSSPGVSTFNTARNATISFNPLSVAGYTQNAEHTAEIDLLPVQYIDGATGEVIQLAEVVARSGQFVLGGSASNFQNSAGSVITALSQFTMDYTARLEIEASPPLI